MEYDELTQEDRSPSQAETLVDEIGNVLTRMNRKLQPVLASGDLSKAGEMKTATEPSPLVNRLQMVLSQAQVLENRINF